MFVSTSFASEVAELDAASMGAGSFRGADLEGADFRVALIGARDVGKSTLLRQLRLDQAGDLELPAEPTPTLKSEEHIFTRTMAGRRGNVTLTVVDTPGQQSAFQKIDPEIFRKPHKAVFCLFRIDSLDSLYALVPSLERLRALLPEPERTCFLLLGLQADRERERQVTDNMASAFAAKHNLQIFAPREISCKTGFDMYLVIMGLVNHCWLMDQCEDDDQNVLLDEEDKDDETRGPHPCPMCGHELPATGNAGGVALLPELMTMCCSIM